MVPVSYTHLDVYKRQVGSHDLLDLLDGFNLVGKRLAVDCRDFAFGEVDGEAAVCGGCHLGGVGFLWKSLVAVECFLSSD